MQHVKISGNSFTPVSVMSVSSDVVGYSQSLIASCLAAAASGDPSAYFDLGVAYSTGVNGLECDLVEAHKWFNLAAVSGHDEAAQCRQEVAEELSSREIAEAQRRAREWLATAPRAA